MSLSPRQKRMIWVFGAILLLGLIVKLTLSALRQNIEWYMTPSELLTYQAVPGEILHLGGYVKVGSMVRHDLEVQFLVTDFTKDIAVRYHGILPGLLREGKGAVITGHMQATEGVFIATEVLAKHDENYQPVARKVHVD